MSKPEDVEMLVSGAQQRFGTVDILVNNAGQMYSGRFDVMTDEGLRQQLETKLFGFLRAIRLVYPAMKAQRWGRIVNMPSISGPSITWIGRPSFARASSVSATM